MELPVSFKDSMQRLLGSEYEQFIATYDNKAVSALRVNTSKITLSEFEDTAPYYIEKIPFISNGYYINDTDAWSKHPYYYAGLYYLQEASAMLPAEMFSYGADDIVLDLCAAPGGKSTQISISGIGLLLSNDISFSRTIPLVKNLDLFGMANHSVMCEDPEKLCTIYPETFDKILVDAPCSGKGMFRKDPGLITSYELKGPEAYRDIQKSLLECAYKMLKKDGTLLYSTCTFSDIEDEQVILSFLEHHKDMTVCDIAKHDGLCGPYDRYSGNDAIAGCVHAFPHRFRGEGHFLALMKKHGGNCADAHSVDLNKSTFTSFPQQAEEFASFFSEGLAQHILKRQFISTKDGLIFMLPDGFAGLYRGNIRYVRTGTCFGSLNRSGKFTAHTAFALTLKADDFTNVLDLRADDPCVIKYLKGETLTGTDTLYDLKKGYVLVCVDHHPLGFANYDGKKLKNFYEKGWIYK
ncbi:MAG: SAM-dependent methyltransferase [Lachnospiraceae bacterium]|nr:SAM-dependent methyltransferase [Lachnospiraceae bacterium]